MTSAESPATARSRRTARSVALLAMLFGLLGAIDCGVAADGSSADATAADAFPEDATSENGQGSRTDASLDSNEKVGSDATIAESGVDARSADAQNAAGDGPSSRDTSSEIAPISTDAGLFASNGGDGAGETGVGVDGSDGDDGGYRGEGGDSGEGGDGADALPAPVIDTTSTLQDWSELLGSACPGNTLLGTPYACSLQQTANAGLQIPSVSAGGGADPLHFLRLAAVPTSGLDQNAIAFVRTAPGGHAVVLTDFDFRITPVEGRGRAEGFGFALLNTAFYPSGAVAAPVAAEEPSFAGSLGFGFDIYADPGDIGNPNILARFSDSISVHYDGAVLNQYDLQKITDLASGLWHHARILVQASGSGSTVSLWITPPCGVAVPIVGALPVAAALPYEARAWLGAHSGAEAANFDFANVRVLFMDATQSWISFGQGTYRAEENQGSVRLTVTRGGDTSGASSVRYDSADLTAHGGVNYQPASGVVTFAAGQTQQTIDIPLIDDTLNETTLTTVAGRADVPDVSESFGVNVSPLSANVKVAGPADARVVIFDDEGSRIYGHWDNPMCWDIIGMHAHLLPTTGNVLYWDRLGNVSQWSPTSGVVSPVDGPGYDLFCAGHAFLADGRLLISGGHNDPLGSPMQDGVGVANLTAFDPLQALPWQGLPTMSGLRWYPTVTVLSDGTALLISGSVDTVYTKNQLSEVYVPASNTLRELTGAVNAGALGAAFYPWMFALPNAKAFKAGPDPQTWLIDTAGQGAWTQTPDRPEHDGVVHDYGSAALLGRRALVFGGGGKDPGGPPPTNSVAAFDLDALSWSVLPGMIFHRRQHNATILPDGRVLVTGGTFGAGFSNRDDAVTPAEIFNGSSWTLLPAELAPRLYHSSALLLADGRVVVSGGGEGALQASVESTAQVYLPDYWFKPRPTLLEAPSAVTYNQAFTVRSSSTIGQVTAIRISSVTHSFNENQRFAQLPFQYADAGGTTAEVGVASDGWMPPGHYLLFVLDSNNIPSQGVVVKVGP